MIAAMISTRRTRALRLEQLRNAHREPSGLEIFLGLSGFVALASTLLYLAAALSR